MSMANTDLRQVYRVNAGPYKGMLGSPVPAKDVRGRADMLYLECLQTGEVHEVSPKTASLLADTGSVSRIKALGFYVIKNGRHYAISIDDTDDQPTEEQKREIPWYTTPSEAAHAFLARKRARKAWAASDGVVYHGISRFCSSVGWSSVSSIEMA